MATSTSNLGLIKPDRSDNYSVDVMANNMDIIDAKITALEAGEFESVNCAGVIDADTVSATTVSATTGYFDDISSMNLSTTSGYIGALYFSQTTTLVSGSGLGVNLTKTYTYKSNPICNTLTFDLSSYGYEGNSTSYKCYGQVKLRINGTQVAATTRSMSSNSTTYTVTLNNNDVIDAILILDGATLGNGGGGSIKMSCEGYLGSF